MIYIYKFCTIILLAPCKLGVYILLFISISSLLFYWPLVNFFINGAANKCPKVITISHQLSAECSNLNKAKLKHLMR